MTDESKQAELPEQVIERLLTSIGHTCHCTSCKQRIAEAIASLTRTHSPAQPDERRLSEIRERAANKYMAPLSVGGGRWPSLVMAQDIDYLLSLLDSQQREDGPVLVEREAAAKLVESHVAKYDDHYIHCLTKCIPEEIRAMAPHSQQPSQWQDISTAPKDRTRILLYFPKLPTHCDQRSNMTVGCWVDSGWWVTALGAGGLCDSDTLPTHWQPLPKGPQH